MTATARTGAAAASSARRPGTTALAGEQRRRTRRRPIAAVTALTALAALAHLPAPAAAQTLRGHVVDDSTAAPLADVVVTVLEDGEPVDRATTDSTGSFAFRLGRARTVRLEGRRLGWGTVLSRAIEVPDGETVSVELWMSVKAIPLAPLVVTARSDLGRSRFHRHMEEWGKGVFITPAMVDSIAPIHAVDVLRGQEETWLSWTMGQRKAVPNVRTYLGQGCLRYMIDGAEVRSWAFGEPGGSGPPLSAAELRRDWMSRRDATGAEAWEDSMLEYLHGREIVAVEYYRYIGEVPPELRRHAYKGDFGMCGLVVYWTALGW